VFKSKGRTYVWEGAKGGKRTEFLLRNYPYFFRGGKGSEGVFTFPRNVCKTDIMWIS